MFNYVNTIYCSITVQNKFRLITVYTYMRNTTGATRGEEYAYPAGYSEINPDFLWDSYYTVFGFICFDFKKVICPFVVFVL